MLWGYVDGADAHGSGGGVGVMLLVVVAVGVMMGTKVRAQQVKHSSKAKCSAHRVCGGHARHPHGS